MLLLKGASLPLYPTLLYKKHARKLTKTFSTKRHHAQIHDNIVLLFV